MLSIDQAAESRFASNTLDELKAYCDQVGVKYSAGTRRSDILRTALLEHMGLGGGFVAEALPKIKTAEADIFPTYNLTPNGIWGGRRHRISLARPEGAVQEQAIPISWNGKHPYWLPFNEVAAVPEPIYNRLKELRKPRPTQVTLDNGDVTTHIEYDDAYHISYHGVDPATKDLCGSLLEFYQRKGPEWLRKRNARQLQMIAQLCDQNIHDRDKKLLPQEDILAKLMVFFFNYADATEAEAA